MNTPEAIAPPPKPIPNIWMVFSRERSRSVCFIYTIPRIVSTNCPNNS
ncbi:MAG: hypothetical protein V7K40_12115 [Nostoc sp.]